MDRLTRIASELAEARFLLFFPDREEIYFKQGGTAGRLKRHRFTRDDLEWCITHLSSCKEIFFHCKEIEIPFFSARTAQLAVICSKHPLTTEETQTYSALASQIASRTPR